METLEYSLDQTLSQKILKNHRGQSTVEFVLTVTLVLGFTFFILQLGLVFAFSNYAQYATFMAARSYLAAGTDRSDQDQRARYVLGYMLKASGFQVRKDRFPSIAKGTGGAGSDFPGLDLGTGSLYSAVNDSTHWMIGARYTFTSKIFPVALGKRRPNAGGTAQNTVKFTSESWLGREPTDAECTEVMQKLKGNVDNGC